MAAKYVLPLFACAFLVAAMWRFARDGFKLKPAARTWILIAVVFAAVSTWLWSN